METFGIKKSGRKQAQKQVQQVQQRIEKNWMELYLIINFMNDRQI